ncbi:hypothetical protein GCM10009623_14240 [Nocardioides aestuarii]|uniref:Rax2-like C-terminal domain-containing protein n=1 Tax=Nocardioides aestuarii TaxID=252231 RepID=A0ABW4TJT1_9ACTN
MRRRPWMTALVTGLALVCAPLAAPVAAVGYPLTQVVSDNPVNTTPHVTNGSVQAIATIGSRVYVGGTFTGVTSSNQATSYTRRYLFAFDRQTGAVLDFAPSLDGVVESIAPAPDGSSLIIGGRFKTVNGTAQRSVAMLRSDGTRVSTFAAKTTGVVNKVIVRGNTLVAGGRFGKANGAPRQNLAFFNASSGSLDSADVPVTVGRTKSNGTVTKPSIVEMDADAGGSRLVILGNFRQVAGQLRQQVAMLDLDTRSLTPWSTSRFRNGPSGGPDAFPCYQKFDTQMRDVEFSPTGSFFVVVTTGGSPDRNASSLCDSATRWETSGGPGSTETWLQCTGGDTLYSVAVTTSAVYLGGHQRWLDNCGGRDSATPGAFSAEGIGAVDPATGRAIRSWNPGRTRGVGAEELVAQAEGLYVGSDTTRLGGEYHARLGRFPTS